MTPTYWLASYPKSGNTWLRMLLAALVLAPGETLDINAPSEAGGMASAREPFDQITLLDSNIMTADEIDLLRPGVHAALANGEYGREATKLDARFVKVHDAWVTTPQGAPLLAGARGAAGAVLVVRDPRSVAPSLAHHTGVCVDEAIAFMADEKFCFGGGTDLRPQQQLRQRLLGWSHHAESWLSQVEIPVLLLRYEDMISDPARELARVLDFAGLPAAPAEIARAAAAADFAQLQSQERERGFRERPRHGKGPFFRQGRVDGWRDELTAAQAAQIVRDHAAMMRRLGYDA